MAPHESDISRTSGSEHYFMGNFLSLMLLLKENLGGACKKQADEKQIKKRIMMYERANMIPGICRITDKPV